MTPSEPGNDSEGGLIEAAPPFLEFGRGRSLNW